MVSLSLSLSIVHSSLSSISLSFQGHIVAQETVRGGGGGGGRGEGAITTSLTPLVVVLNLLCLF